MKKCELAVLSTVNVKENNGRKKWCPLFDTASSLGAARLWLRNNNTSSNVCSDDSTTPDSSLHAAISAAKHLLHLNMLQICHLDFLFTWSYWDMLSVCGLEFKSRQEWVLFRGWLLFTISAALILPWPQPVCFLFHGSERNDSYIWNIWGIKHHHPAFNLSASIEFIYMFPLREKWVSEEGNLKYGHSKWRFSISQTFAPGLFFF